MAVKNHEPVEVLIVGCGIAGSTMAALLSENGFQVLALEAGPERKLSDLYSSQIWARRIKWAGPPVVEEGDLVGGINFGMGWGTGGAGLHWYANWYRFHDEDFKVKSLFGRGLDWPIEYIDLHPYYDQAQAWFGVSGDLEKEIWSPPAEPYPMPALPELPQARAIRQGFETQGMRTSPNPVAINSQEYDGRNGCTLDGWCDAGCAIGALASPLSLQWPKAKSAGAKLQHNSYVTKLVTDAAGRNVTGAEYVDENGEQHFQPAAIVILACHTVSNSRLLLLSANEKHPKGLANGSGMLGHHFMSHPMFTVHGIFPEPTEPSRGITGANLLCQDGYDNKEPEPGAFGSRSWLAGQAAKPNDLLGLALARPELYGAELDEYLQKASRHFGNMTALCEENSVFENRVELHSGTTDKYGLPIAKVINNVPAENAARLELARAEGLAVFKSAGAKEVWAGQRGAMHLVGGTVMGEDPDSSIANSFGQTHEIDNVFIAGASLFPTVAAVNPTATLAALAFRTADYITDNKAMLTK